jgi:hypothetical protein
MKRKTSIQDILAPIKDIVARLQGRRRDLMEEVNLLDSELTRLGGSSKRGRGKAAAAGGPVRRGKRRRRKREDIEAQAAEVVEFISSAGKAGASGKEIKTKFGNLLPSVNAWLKNYSKAKVRTSGEKSTMRYYA